MKADFPCLGQKPVRWKGTAGTNQQSRTWFGKKFRVWYRKGKKQKKKKRFLLSESRQIQAVTLTALAQPCIKNPLVRSFGLMFLKVINSFKKTGPDSLALRLR